MALETTAALPPIGRPGLAWLGQAGFWIETGRHRILIDPYLSDSLARKYAGKPNDHRRMMPPPLAPEALPRPDIVLVTHAHGDHMDADTLGPLAERFPDLPFVVPAARLDIARQRIGAAAVLVAADASERLAPLADLALRVFPAAHENLERDAAGRHVFLGYGIEAPGLRLYHSGDTIPFAGLAEALGEFAPDIVLLPVNGRDAARLAAGIPGNLTLIEAIALAEAAGAPVMVPHHFGMFAFNTLDEAAIDAAAARQDRPRIVKPRPGAVMTFGEGMNFGEVMTFGEGEGHGPGRDDHAFRQSP